MHHISGTPIANISGEFNNASAQFNGTYFYSKCVKHGTSTMSTRECSHMLNAPQIQNVEKVLRTVTRWTCRRWRNSGGVGDMLSGHEWPSLEAHRERSSLAFFYKIRSGAVSPGRD